MTEVKKCSHLKTFMLQNFLKDNEEWCMQTLLTKLREQVKLEIAIPHSCIENK